MEHRITAAGSGCSRRSSGAFRRLSRCPSGARDFAMTTRVSTTRVFLISATKETLT